MFLDANQEKAKSPNKLFEIFNSPVFEESRKRIKFIETVEALVMDSL